MRYFIFIVACLLVTGSVGCSSFKSEGGNRTNQGDSAAARNENLEQETPSNIDARGNGAEENSAGREITFTAKVEGGQPTAGPLSVEDGEAFILDWEAKGYKTCRLAELEDQDGANGLTGSFTISGVAENQEYTLECLDDKDEVVGSKSINIIVMPDLPAGPTVQLRAQKVDANNNPVGALEDKSLQIDFGTNYRLEITSANAFECKLDGSDVPTGESAPHYVPFINFNTDDRKLPHVLSCTDSEGNVSTDSVEIIVNLPDTIVGAIQVDNLEDADPPSTTGLTVESGDTVRVSIVAQNADECKVYIAVAGDVVIDQAADSNGKVVASYTSDITRLTIYVLECLGPNAGFFRTAIPVHIEGQARGSIDLFARVKDGSNVPLADIDPDVIDLDDPDASFNFATTSVAVPYDGTVEIAWRSCAFKYTNGQLQLGEDGQPVCDTPKPDCKVVTLDSEFPPSGTADSSKGTATTVKQTISQAILGFCSIPGGNTVYQYMRFNVERAPAPTLDFFANGREEININYGDDVHLSWTTTGVSSDSCHIRSPFIVEQLPTNGEELLNNVTQSMSVYMTCTGAGGSVTDVVIINVGRGDDDPECNAPGCHYDNAKEACNSDEAYTIRTTLLMPKVGRYVDPATNEVVNGCRWGVDNNLGRFPDAAYTVLRAFEEQEIAVPGTADTYLCDGKISTVNNLYYNDQMVTLLNRSVIHSGVEGFVSSLGDRVTRMFFWLKDKVLGSQGFNVANIGDHPHYCAAVDQNIVPGANASEKSRFCQVPRFNINQAANQGPYSLEIPRELGLKLSAYKLTNFGKDSTYNLAFTAGGDQDDFDCTVGDTGPTSDTIEVSIDWKVAKVKDE